MLRLIKFNFVLFLFCFLTFRSYANFNKNKENNGLKTVTLLLDWKPNTNHLGIYIAKINGYYKKYGIQLKILNPAQTTSTALVGMEKADFGISYASDLIYARNANIPVVSVAGILQNDTSCFVWRKSSQIKSINDFEGKRYGGWGSPEERAVLKYVLEKNGLIFSKVKMLLIGSQDFLQATLKNVDFTWEYKGWNILAAELNNVPIGTYCPSEHFPELNKPSPLIITSQNMLTKHPEVVKNFLKATALGYDFSMKNPQQAANEFIKNVPGIDSNLVHASALYLASLNKLNSIKWGYQNEIVFENYINWMKKMGVIKNQLKIREYINNEFLP